MPYLTFVIICMIWGASFLLMKKAGVVFSPFDIALWRVVGGGAVLVLMAAAGRRTWRLEKRYLIPLVVVSLFSYAWPYAVQPYLVTLHGSGFIGMTVSFTPLLTVLVGVPMFGLYPSVRQLLGIVGGLFFLGLILLDGFERNMPWYDLLLAFSVPLCYAIGNSLIRLWFSGVPVLAMTASAMLLTSLFMIPLAVVTDASRPDSGPHSLQSWMVGIICGAILGTLGTGLASVLFNRLIQEQGPLFAGMVTYIVPIGALLWGWIDTEVVTARQLVALGGVLCMVAVVQYGSAVKPADSPALPHSGEEII